MKKLFTLLVAIFALTSFGQNCNAYFSDTLSGSEVFFTDMSSDNLNNAPTSWYWDFGDGTSSTTQNPMHYYQDTTHSYVVCLTAMFASQCTSTFCDTIDFPTNTNPCSSFSGYISDYQLSDPNVCDGELFPNIYGGTPPYTYYWGNGATTQNLMGLCEGSYILNIVDVNHCQLTLSGLVFSDTTITNSCSSFSGYIPNYQLSDPNVCDGELFPNIYGGTPPYTYYWGNGATTQNLMGLCEGSYILNIVDSNGCQLTLSGNVLTDTSNYIISDTLSNNVDTCFNFQVQNAYIQSTTLIDSLTLEIVWIYVGTNQETATVTETYTFDGQYGYYLIETTVNCTAKSSQTWGEIILIDENIILSVNDLNKTNFGLNLYPNPVKDYLTIEYKLEQSSQVQLEIIDYSGKIVSHNKLNSYKGENSSVMNVSNLANGIYFVRVISNKNIETIKFVK